MAKRDNVINFINKLEGFKSAALNFHWASKNLSQHKLCEEIADAIADFQDKVSEVEQSINGKFKLNVLKAEPYKETNLRAFVEDVLDATNEFMKTIEGDTYAGMKSDCESFLSDMQRNLYLVDFTLKEELKRSLRESLTRAQELEDGNNLKKLIGRRPTSIKARINRIYSIVKYYKIDSKLYHDDHWQAMLDYKKAIESLGAEFSYWCENGGYTDYDQNDNMPRSKEYKVEITFDDGMKVGGYAKMMAAGTVEDPFSSYDTCIVLWPKSNKVLEMTANELKSIVNESVNILLEKSGIHIDPKNKGKFTESQKETGKSTEELTHSKNPLTRKRANFAKMAKRHWKPLKDSE